MPAISTIPRRDMYQLCPRKRGELQENGWSVVVSLFATETVTSLTRDGFDKTRSTDSDDTHQTAHRPRIAFTELAFAAACSARPLRPRLACRRALFLFAALNALFRVSANLKADDCPGGLFC